ASVSRASALTRRFAPPSPACGRGFPWPASRLSRRPPSAPLAPPLPFTGEGRGEGGRCPACQRRDGPRLRPAFPSTKRAEVLHRLVHVHVSVLGVAEPETDQLRFLVAHVGRMTGGLQPGLVGHLCERLVIVAAQRSRSRVGED